MPTQPLSRRLVTEATLPDLAPGAIEKGNPNGVAPLDDDGVIPEEHLPDRLSETGLTASINEVGSTAFAPIATLALSNNVAYFGDSKPGYGDPVSATSTNIVTAGTGDGSYADYTTVLSKAQIVRRARISHSGWKSDQLLGVISEITSLAGQVAICLNDIGTNDANNDVPVATFMANMEAIYAAQRAAGILPVVMTQPPLTGAKGVWVLRYNERLRRYARTNRLPLVDVYAALVDPATGNMRSAMDVGDGIHANTYGRYATALAIIAALGPLLPPASKSVVAMASGGINLIAGSAMLVDTNADGVADNFGFTSKSGFTPSLVADTDGFKWQRFTLASVTGNCEVHSDTITTGFAPGDKLAFAAKLRTGQAGLFAPKVVCYSSGFANLGVTSLVSDASTGSTVQVTPDGVGYKELIVPASTANIVFQVVAGPSSGTSSGTYDFALPTLINLTALGLA